MLTFIQLGSVGAKDVKLRREKLEAKHFVHEKGKQQRHGREVVLEYLRSLNIGQLSLCVGRQPRPRSPREQPSITTWSTKPALLFYCSSVPSFSPLLSQITWDHYAGEDG